MKGGRDGVLESNKGGRSGEKSAAAKAQINSHIGTGLNGGKRQEARIVPLSSAFGLSVERAKRVCSSKKSKQQQRSTAVSEPASLPPHFLEQAMLK